MHLFIPFSSHILIHPPHLSSLIPSSSKNTPLVPCQHHSPLPPLILLCDNNLYMVCTHALFSFTSFTTFQSLIPPLLSTYFYPKYTFLSTTLLSSPSQHQFPLPPFHTFPSSPFIYNHTPPFLQTPLFHTPHNTN
jgi:hypothetical protein